ncbi:DUF7344 domain-containing protein [Haloarchaeobius iranensis]|uniref:DUF7344 domain-containing protein n=1 Tax=Haloarchaeobius iranensis TaxID=996166 RepID=A0A1H0BTB7_9EURY|nr:hypothetical protein [Haloarchaeobius iranensis]SDN48817.1 hypothetical protein SAMN05192554_1477 [Haloarchaeobius iranensis]
MSNAPINSLDDVARAQIAHLSEDDYHRLLTSGRRRKLLSELTTLTPPVPRRALARTVAEREAGADDTRAALVDRIEISLHHVHLPMMAELGVLEYDSTAEQIRW